MEWEDCLILHQSFVSVPPEIMRKRGYRNGSLVWNEIRWFYFAQGVCVDTKKKNLYWQILPPLRSDPANIYLFNINKRNTRERCEICSKLTTKTLVFLLLTLNIFYTFSSVSVVNFEEVHKDVIGNILCSLFQRCWYAQYFSTLEHWQSRFYHSYFTRM